MLEAENTLRKPVIAMRAGNSLRHAELALNQPFHMPLRGVQDSRMKVSLYETLGTQTIKDADEAESVCDVPVRTPDGKCSQVKLRIRRGPPATGPNFKSSSVGVENYLNVHQLEARIQSLFEIVLKKQPQDPYRCMIEELQKIKRSGGEETAVAADVPTDSAAPKAPVAPSGPPPQKARPSPAGKGRNVKPSDSSEAETAAQAALAEVMPQDGKNGSAKLGNGAVRPDGVLSNGECATLVMRLVLTRVAPLFDNSKVLAESSSLGTARIDARARAVEHVKNVRVSHYVTVMVMQAAYNRLQARSLGFLNGGTSQSDEIVRVHDPADYAQKKALTSQVVMSTLRKASVV